MPASGATNFSLLSDTSSLFSTTYGRTSYDDSSRTLFAAFTSQYNGQSGLAGQLLVAVKNISDPTVTLAAPDGFTPDGLPYYDLSSLFTGSLASGTSITGKSLAFYDPNEVRFTYQLEFLSKLNHAPVFSSVPIVQAEAAVPFVYDLAATDPDGDSLTFSLLSGPTGLILNTSGIPQLDWTPSASDVGQYPIDIQVSDGNGATLSRTSFSPSKATSPIARPISYPPPLSMPPSEPHTRTPPRPSIPTATPSPIPSTPLPPTSE